MKNTTIKTDPPKLAKALQAYENKWVALVGNKVVAAGESVKEVKQKAEEAGHKILFEKYKKRFEITPIKLTKK